MTRRTAYEVAQANLQFPVGEDGLWQLMLKLDEKGPWAVPDVEGATQCTLGAITNYVYRLKRGGFIVEVGSVTAAKGGLPTKLLKLAKKPHDAPRLGRDGKELKERLVETIWRTIKLCKVFTPTEIAELASTPERPITPHRVRIYMGQLLKANIVVQIKQPSKKGDGTYQLLNNVGPKAPKVFATLVVYDPNNHAILYTPPAREVQS